MIQERGPHYYLFILGKYLTTSSCELFALLKMQNGKALTFFAYACHAQRAGQTLQKNRFQKFCPKIGAGALLNMQPGMTSAVVMHTNISTLEYRDLWLRLRLRLRLTALPKFLN